TLYVPTSFKKRAIWVETSLSLSPQNAVRFGFDEIIEVDASWEGPFFSKEKYQKIQKKITAILQEKGKIFILNPSSPSAYIDQRVVINQLINLIPNMQSSLVDVSPIIAQMRRKKDMREIEQLYKAVEITSVAHEAAAQTIKNNVTEIKVQANLEYIMTNLHAQPAFSSIVACGKNATILHYTSHHSTMQNNELTLVDIGARYNYYCADLTRTYPVSGRFTWRQREIYDIVLETQEYIESIAKPGYWLKNEKEQNKSLHHLACSFLKERGYDQYFYHSIGHYLGLDVHDVGSYETPLQKGDVITIEPGIYIPEEGIGIRIEDDYWMLEDGIICLSEELPKGPSEIEGLVQQSL
ncbi:MAG: M24 family metallopeptidase, partial [Candidatus Babeliales bacterium]